MVIVTVQLVALPEQAPVQPTKVLPEAAAAVRVTVVPLAKDCVQLPAPEQLIPAGLEVTAPAPPIVTCSGSIWMADAKLAPTVSAALTVITQLSAVPEHAPLQPTNVSPGEGAAFSVTVLPTGNDWVQPPDPAQSIPAGLELTLPLPPTVTNTVSAVVGEGEAGLDEAPDEEGCPAADADETEEFPSKSVPRPPPQPASKLATTQSTPKRIIDLIFGFPG